MYYLVVKNLGQERCIHRSEQDIYEDGMAFPCTPDLEYVPGLFIRELKIVCSELPHTPLSARVFSD